MNAKGIARNFEQSFKNLATYETTNNLNNNLCNKRFQPGTKYLHESLSVLENFALWKLTTKYWTHSIERSSQDIDGWGNELNYQSAHKIWPPVRMWIRNTSFKKLLQLSSSTTHDRPNFDTRNLVYLSVSLSTHQCVKLCLTCWIRCVEYVVGWIRCVEYVVLNTLCWIRCVEYVVGWIRCVEYFVLNTLCWIRSFIKLEATAWRVALEKSVGTTCKTYQFGIFLFPPFCCFALLLCSLANPTWTQEWNCRGFLLANSSLEFLNMWFDVMMLK